jgi:hypothetical protein
MGFTRYTAHPDSATRDEWNCPQLKKKQGERSMASAYESDMRVTDLINRDEPSALLGSTERDLEASAGYH